MQYKVRRDFFIDYLHDKVHLTRGTGTEGVWLGSPIYTAYVCERISAISENIRESR